MALQGNDAAFVAAQLTSAWAQVYATKNGASALTEEQVAKRIAAAYDSFAKAILAGEIGDTAKHMR